MILPAKRKRSPQPSHRVDDTNNDDAQPRQSGRKHKHVMPRKPTLDEEEGSDYEESIIEAETEKFESMESLAANLLDGPLEPLNHPNSTNWNDMVTILECIFVNATIQCYHVHFCISSYIRNARGAR